MASLASIESSELNAQLLRRVAEVVSAYAGLAVQGHRLSDLARSVADAARELHLPTAEPFLDRLLASPPSHRELESLVSHFCVGETYFFRDPAYVEALRSKVLPQLVRARNARPPNERSIRIWSAGCSSGEEPYTLSMLLELAIPALDAFDVTILATDINSQALRTAERAVYREWSLRGVPPELRERFFRERGDGLFEVVPRVRSRVRFAHLNLAGDGYPSPVTETCAMDLIVCRNVLMYFEPERAAQVVGRFEQALRDDGVLALGPVEGLPDRASGLSEVLLDGAVLYRKDVHHATPPGLRRRGPTPIHGVEQQPRIREVELCEAARAAYRCGDYVGAARMASEWLAQHPSDARTMAMLARLRADQGMRAEALEWSARALAINKLDPVAHYVHANILLELGRSGEAAASFKRVLFLDQDFALAHYALGMLARAEGRLRRAQRYLRNAQSILLQRNVQEEVAQSDGMTAARLARIIGSMSDHAEASA